MQINDELKQEILEKLSKSNSEYFKKSIYDDFLGIGYIDSNHKPTQKLIFLEFESFDLLIEHFYKEMNAYHNGFQIEYFKYPKKDPKKDPPNDLEETIKTEKNKFMQKFIKVYEIIRDEFGAKLQKYNEIYICPYCEKNYINIVKTDTKELKPDLDHFYPKSLYPFLACSVENLIPSCQMCNSRLKGNIDFHDKQHINPLKYRLFKDIKFSYDAKGIMIKNINELQQNENKKNYLNTFEIEKIYATHNEVLEEIQNKFKMYNSVKIRQIKENCFALDEKEILDIIFYEYKNENKKNPLRKLKKDLYEKFNEYQQILAPNR